MCGWVILQVLWIILALACTALVLSLFRLEDPHSYLLSLAVLPSQLLSSAIPQGPSLWKCQVHTSLQSGRCNRFLPGADCTASTRSFCAVDPARPPRPPASVGPRDAGTQDRLATWLGQRLCSCNGRAAHFQSGSGGQRPAFTGAERRDTVSRQSCAVQRDEQQVRLLVHSSMFGDTPAPLAVMVSNRLCSFKGKLVRQAKSERGPFLTKEKLQGYG